MSRSRLELDTPALVIDLDALERNIAWLSRFFREQGVAWRPHAKSYQCARLARMVVDAGAIGVTCAKLGEAEVFGAAGIRDLLITCPLVGPRKLARLVELRRLADPIAVVDHADHVRALEQAAASGGVRLRVMIELELGMNRCGAIPGPPVLELARQIADAPHLDLAGIMGWEGHLLMIADATEKSQKIREAMTRMDESRQMLESEGLPCPIVSAGGTGSFPMTATTGLVTEIQAGGAIFMDLFYRNKCHIEPLEFALTVMASVTSRPTPQRAVIDVGRKSLNPDLHLPAVKGREDLRFQWLSAEHGVLEVVAPPGPSIGDRLELIPGYGDWSTLLHDRYHVFRGDQLEDIWPLDARTRTA